MRTWLIYVRKSVVRTETDMESPERQLHVCNTLLQITESEPYATEVYQDLDKSGSTEAGRDDWLRLKQQLERPEVVGVISFSLDRIYRNVAEFLAFLNEIERHKKTLKTAKENLDTSGPLGRFVVTILMALYEMEWRLTSVRMIDMIEHKRRNQGRHWGTAPFGTERDNEGQLVPSKLTYLFNEEPRYFFDALTECFRLYASGTMGYEHVAATLNAIGWRFWHIHKRPGQKSEYTPTDWDSEKVRSVIGRWRIYRGDLPLGNPVKNPYVEWVPGGHQPILPTELCNSVSTVLGERSKRLWNRSGENRRVYVLTPLAHCQHCGMMLTGNTVRERRLYRHRYAKGNCPEAWTYADAIEEQLDAALVELNQHPTLFNNVAVASRHLAPTDTNLQEKQYDLQRKLSRLEDLYINEAGISKAEYLRRRGELLNDLAEIELQYQQGGGNLAMIADQVLSSLSLTRYANPKTKKALVSNMIKRLDIAGGEIQAMVPQEWATPFFSACSEWAGWESNPTSTTPKIITWFNALSEV